MLTKEARESAIDWLCDCSWADLDAEEAREVFEDLSDAALIHALNRHYDGGYESFLETMEAVCTE